MLKLTNILSQLADNGFIYQEGENGLLENFKQSKLQFEAGKPNLSVTSRAEKDIGHSKAEDLQIATERKELMSSNTALKSARSSYKLSSSHSKWERIAKESAMKTEKHSTDIKLDKEIRSEPVESQISTKSKNESIIDTIPVSTSPRLGGN